MRRSLALDRWRTGWLPFAPCSRALRAGASPGSALRGEEGNDLIEGGVDELRDLAVPAVRLPP